MITRPVFIDGNGRMMAPSYTVASTSDAQDWLDVLGGWTTQPCNVRHDTVIVPMAIPGHVGMYQSVLTQAQLTFGTDSSRQTMRIIVPGPQDRWFLSDGEVVDATAIAPVITAALAYLRMPDGSPVTRYIGGTRREVWPSR